MWEAIRLGQIKFLHVKYRQTFAPWNSNREVARTLETLVMGILRTSPWQRLAGVQYAEWSRRLALDVPASSTIIRPLLQLHSFRIRPSCLQIKVLLIWYGVIKWPLLYCHFFAFPNQFKKGSSTWEFNSKASTFLTPFHAEMKKERALLFYSS